jgi:hypothetical protein
MESGVAVKVLLDKHHSLSPAGRGLGEGRFAMASYNPHPNPLPDRERELTFEYKLAQQCQSIGKNAQRQNHASGRIDQSRIK